MYFYRLTEQGCLRRLIVRSPSMISGTKEDLAAMQNANETCVTHSSTTRPQPAAARSPYPFAMEILEHRDQMLASEHFDGSSRSRDFLSFIVDEALAGRGDQLTQATIAARVFGRSGNFDAILDPVVRVQAGRLRRSLERYYLLSGDSGAHIELPKGSYAPVFSVAAERASSTDEPRLKRISLVPVAPSWPAMLVRPFEGSGSEAGDVAIRLNDTLIMELGRYHDVRVLRPRDIERLDPDQNVHVRYELLGRIRRESDDWTVTTWLVDRTNGEQVWGDEYRVHAPTREWSSALEDVALVIAARVGAEHGVVVRLLTNECSHAGTSAQGFGAIMRCYSFFLCRRVEDFAPTVEALKRQVEREPGTTIAWGYLSRLYQVNYSFELTDLATPIDQAVSFAYQGVILDPTNSRIRVLLAISLLTKGEVQAARHELEAALRHNPHSLAYREIIGWLLALSGDWERGMDIMRDALARNPYCLPHTGHGLWADHLRRGEFEQAYIAALEYRDPAFFWRELMITCCLGHLGRVSEARAHAAELIRIKPTFARRGRTLIGHYIKESALRDRVVDGLRRAGIVLS